MKLNELKTGSFSDIEIWGAAFLNDTSVLDDQRIWKLRDPQGDTPLHYFAKNGEIKILKISETFKVKGVFGATPFHYLAEAVSDDDDALQELMKFYEYYTLKDRRGLTPDAYNAMANYGDSYESDMHGC